MIAGPRATMSPAGHRRWHPRRQSGRRPPYRHLRRRQLSVGRRRYLPEAVILPSTEPRAKFVPSSSVTEVSRQKLPLSSVVEAVAEGRSHGEGGHSGPPCRQLRLEAARSAPAERWDCRLPPPPAASQRLQRPRRARPGHPGWSGGARAARSPWPWRRQRRWQRPVNRLGGNGGRSRRIRRGVTGPRVGAGGWPPATAGSAGFAAGGVAGRSSASKWSRWSLRVGSFLMAVTPRGHAAAQPGVNVWC